MNLYFELLKKPVFSIEDVNAYYDNVHSARSAVGRLLREQLIVKIRNNMYTCINGETGSPVANRFQIACKITPSSYISHHTAMEYYGLADQVFYDVYVSSETTFREFEFDGYCYHCIVSKRREGVVSPAFSGGVHVTDLERTLLDSVKDMDKISGMEEVVQNIGSIQRIQEKKLLLYLNLYQNQFLYQKTGYLLKGLSSQMGLSNEFFDFCKRKIGKSKRYFTADVKMGTYNDEWKMVVPDGVISAKNGVTEDASI